jgi:hypothetical protein
MKSLGQHISIDQLTALAFVARAPELTVAEDQAALDHIAACDVCAAELATLTSEADGLRDFAFSQADEVFDDAMLEAQRTRILDRLAHLGQAARVLSFPRRSRETRLPVSATSRRWVSAAAVAGLIIGLVAGQMLHFVPSGTINVRDDRQPAASIQGIDRPAGPMLISASSSTPVLSDDELMDEVEASIAVRRAASLRALDALTPTAAELLVMGR